jgi:signal transduction histidine kinase
LPDEIATVEGRTKSGEAIWLQRSMNSIDCLLEPMVLGNVVDVTAQKNAENALRVSEHELRNLSDRLLLEQEAERKRIALELHDGIGQSLSAIKFSVEMAMQNSEDQTAAQNRQYLENVVGKLRSAIEEVRAISMGLRPSMLDDLGLITTIDWLCREFQSLNPDIRLDKRISIAESDVPDALKIVVFRILQEALNNIEKHARATAVAVELARTVKALILRVKDNGRGILPKARQLATGVGLGSMKERAQLSAGNFSIDTSTDSGTVIQVVWSSYGLEARFSD